MSAGPVHHASLAKGGKQEVDGQMFKGRVDKRIQYGQGLRIHSRAGRAAVQLSGRGLSLHPPRHSVLVGLSSSPICVSTISNKAYFPISEFWGFFQPSREKDSLTIMKKTRL